MRMFKNWLRGTSSTFRALTGEEYTRREVLLVNAIFMCGCGAAVVAASSLSVTAILLIVAVVLAWRLNDER